MRKKVRRERPFSPGDPDGPRPEDCYPKCGVGKDVQIDIHNKLFDVAGKKSGMYFPELIALTKKMNGIFDKVSGAYLPRKRIELGRPTLHLTLALYKGKLYITYALPSRRRRRSKQRFSK